MFESNEFLGRNDDRETCRDARNDDAARRKQQIKNRLSPRTAPAVDRWVEEQMFEEDVRAVLLMMRPHSRERLMGWSEYRTGGKHFRATVSWDEEFAADAGTSPDPQATDDVFSVPNFADVLEALLVGSIRSELELTTEEETETYRAVLSELARRVEQRAQCAAF
jgi:hypothetical protein